jgi:hypothetical protein
MIADGTPSHLRMGVLDMNENPGHSILSQLEGTPWTTTNLVQLLAPRSTSPST